MTRFFCLLLALTACPLAAQSLPAWATPDATTQPDGEPPLDPRFRLTSANPPTTPGTPTSVPLDGGLTLLAVAGGAYAARRLRQQPPR